MDTMRIGYARCSTNAQDLEVQRRALRALDVAADRVYVDHGLTGRNRDRPGLREALAACRAGDTLVVTKLDRLARSVPDARDIADELSARQVKLAMVALITTGIAVTVYDAARRYPTERDARTACLTALGEGLAAANQDDVRLVIEQDESLLDRDRRTL